MIFLIHVLLKYIFLAIKELTTIQSEIQYQGNNFYPSTVGYSLMYKEV